MSYKLLFALLTFFLASFKSEAQNSQPQKVAITGVKIYPSPLVEPISRGTILIENEKVKAVGYAIDIAIPTDYRTINGEGLVATAGFWNSHVHFIEPHWQGSDTAAVDKLDINLRKMLTSFGFVYAFDLASLDVNNLNSLRERIRTGDITGPTIFAVGVPFTSHSPYYIAPARLPELVNVQEVEAHLEAQFFQGADGIKIWTASPTGNTVKYMSSELIRKAGDLCDLQDKPLFAHPSDNEGVELALENGVDILTHVSPDDRVKWGSALVQQMVAKDMALIPTLKLYKWELEKEGIIKEDNTLLATALEQVNQFAQAGGTILFGTDVGYMPDYDPADEYLMMEKAGMSFQEILASLTTNPAARFGYQRTGKIEAGLDADLVLLESDPAEDITNFTNVAYTIHKGKIIFQKGNKDVQK